MKNLPACAPAAPAQPPVEPPPPATAACADEYVRFDAAIDALLRDDALEPDALAAELRRSLDSEALMNLGDAAHFERRVAERLAGGWRPGHEVLFRAACATFGWARDPARPAALGPAGAVIRQAVVEQQRFDRQHPEDIEYALALIGQLHQPPDDDDELWDLQVGFDQLAADFPVWLRMNAPAASIARLQRSFAASFDVKPVDSPEEERRRQDVRRRFKYALWGVALCVALAAGLVQVRKLGWERALEREHSQWTGKPEPVPRRTELPEEHRRRIEHGIAYHGSVAELPATLSYKIFLGADRQAVVVMPMQRSGLPPFDAAVASAVRAAEPYPADMAPSFTLTIARPER
ncbi:hypothetical protein IP92_04959 [Pseudoduganella flava]|uniref:Uncharacterized protein n=1 Tax=Pseudoduganella flava TaxID=871742 RepID=A0A562PG11_9BURK|nr:hypothetical protein [Pseudoduganella flava]QGZ40215.1 hypothetical protein GO485_14940 [Pseudoduganella flava]TWI43395.1 hypothetical protein IP92_04959 [Pseudoduganella flava]